MKGIPNHNKLILFDGVCNLCNSSVQYIIRRDKSNIFLFAPLQSDIGKKIINDYHIDTEQTDSILLYETKKGVTSKSLAALKIASKLSFPTNLLSICFIIPPFIRNWVYDYVAKNRYRWFGKKEQCMIPSPELESKFI